MNKPNTAYKVMEIEEKYDLSKTALRKVLVEIEKFLDKTLIHNKSRERWKLTAKNGRETLKRLTDDDDEMLARSRNQAWKNLCESTKNETTEFYPGDMIQEKDHPDYIYRVIRAPNKQCDDPNTTMWTSGNIVYVLEEEKTLECFVDLAYVVEKEFELTQATENRAERVKCISCQGVGRMIKP